MWHAGRKLVLAVVLTSGLVLGFTETASAQFGQFVVCWATAEFGSVFRGTFFSIGDGEFSGDGRDRVFENRPWSGGAFVPPGGTSVQIGITYFPSNGNTLTWLFRFSLLSGSGPFTLTSANGTVSTGTGFFIACPAGSGPIEASGPDPAGE